MKRNNEDQNNSNRMSSTNRISLSNPRNARRQSASSKSTSLKKYFVASILCLLMMNIHNASFFVSHGTLDEDSNLMMEQMMDMDGNENENGNVQRNGIESDSNFDTKSEGPTKMTSHPVIERPSPSLRTNSGSNAAVVVEDETKSPPSNGFTRYEGVVIATKVLGSGSLKQLKQWICFINHAYNDKMKYDVVVFTTVPWSAQEITQLQLAGAPAKITVAVEGPPLNEQLAAMSDDELAFLRKRCGLADNSTKPLTWYHHCTEPGYRHPANLGYSWQAEFRAYHIWTHPAIKDYKYMMWLDGDAGVGREWDVDPMKTMVENDLTVLYAGWPYGKLHNSEPVQKKLMRAYNTSICSVQRFPINSTQAIEPDGNQTRSGSGIYAKTCNGKANVFQLAGNHHITNLDVFRKDVHQKFLKDFVGDYRFSRRADDQIAVTIVGLMEQYLVNKNNSSTSESVEDEIPKKPIVWHERSNGLTLKIAHHGFYDVIKSEKAAHRFHAHLNRVKGEWPGLEERCGALF